MIKSQARQRTTPWIAGIGPSSTIRARRALCSVVSLAGAPGEGMLISPSGPCSLNRRYSPLHAAGAYQLRRRREALIEKDRALRTFVLDRLAEGWTPEQIAGWLKAGNERRLRAVGCETIYAFIYRAAQKAEQLWRYLTRRH